MDIHWKYIENKEVAHELGKYDSEVLFVSFEQSQKTYYSKDREIKENSTALRLNRIRPSLK